jgi:alkaline phosphatase
MNGSGNLARFILMTALSFSSIASGKIPKNIILFIVDGMGPEQLEVGRIYVGAKEFVLDSFPVKGQVTTCNAHGLLKNGDCDPNSTTVTDSAAAATAMATGKKVSNGVLSRALPGDNKNLSTILEKMKAKKKSTGLVTTCLSTDATPAAFGAHVARRAAAQDIANQYFANSTPNIILGASLPFMKAMATGATVKYNVVASNGELEKLRGKIKRGKLACKNGRCPHVLGLFGSHPLLPNWGVELGGTLPLEASGKSRFESLDLPHLSDMTQAAVELLNQNKNGFFLMVESGLVDWIGHKNPFFEGGASPSAVEALAKELEEANKALKYLNPSQKCLSKIMMDAKCTNAR